MVFNNFGEIIFNDVFELTYELLNEMELSVESNGVAYDQTTATHLADNGNMIKFSTVPTDIKYAGQGEVAYDPLTSIKINTSLLGYYIDKRIKEEGMPFVSYFQEETVDENDIKKSALTIKYDSINSSTTHYYYNPNLKLIELIFVISGQRVDLSNFDSIDEKLLNPGTKKIRRR